ncbi:UNVERIFIED_CONTAM: hypothetical protein Sradi_5884800 [Sesamum radiatum]|uniref:Uncharacterized protein n=1 Tax=Sesamum radiatum TaxID=300843 RepID=A0AAW2KR34_SESRA
MSKNINFEGLKFFNENDHPACTHYNCIVDGLNCMLDPVGNISSVNEFFPVNNEIECCCEGVAMKAPLNPVSSKIVSKEGCGNEEADCGWGTTKNPCDGDPIGDDSNWTQTGNAFMLLDKLTEEGEFVETSQSQPEDDHNTENELGDSESNQLVVTLSVALQKCLKILDPSCPLNRNPMDTESGTLLLQDTTSPPVQTKDHTLTAHDENVILSDDQKTNALHKRSKSYSSQAPVFKLRKRNKKVVFSAKDKVTKCASSSSNSS